MTAIPDQETTTPTPLNVERLRQDFPILAQKINGHRLAFLDSAASSQRPQCVIDAVRHYYERDHANVHRGVHTLSHRATEAYEGAREKVRQFINAASTREIVFTRGTTDSINLLAASFGQAIEAGDEIVLSVMEHHANIVPWHFLRERQGVVLKWVDVDATGALDPERVIDAIGPKTKLVAVTHLSNVLGTRVDVKAITEGAHARGVPVLVDGSQAAVHMAVDVADIGCNAGTQSTVWAQQGHAVHGIDINEPLVDIARRRNRETGLDIDFRVGTATDLPWASASMESACCRNCWSTFPNGKRCSTKPAGCCVRAACCT
jgi:cysteine desulfurase (EC 2.8.1.7)